MMKCQHKYEKIAIIILNLLFCATMFASAQKKAENTVQQIGLLDRLPPVALQEKSKLEKEEKKKRQLLGRRRRARRRRGLMLWGGLKD